MAETLGDLTRTHYAGTLRPEHVGQTVTLMGWAATRRDLGGVIFIDLRDREGICQVVARPEVSKAAHDSADHVRGEYVLAVIGEVDMAGINRGEFGDHDLVPPGRERCSGI